MPQLMRKKKEDVDLNKGYGVMGRAFGSGAPATNVQPVNTFVPGQTPAPVPTPAPVQNTPPYNIYDPNGPEVAAGRSLTQAVFPDPQARMDEKRRASAGHQAYMDGERNQTGERFFGPMAQTPQERMDEKRRNSAGHKRYMAGIRTKGNAAPDEESSMVEAVPEAAATPAADKNKKKRSLNPLDYVPIELFGGPEAVMERQRTGEKTVPEQLQGAVNNTLPALNDLAEKTPAAGLVRGAQEGWQGTNVHDARSAGEGVRNAVVGGAKGLYDSVVNSPPVEAAKTAYNDYIEPFAQGALDIGPNEANAMTPPGAPQVTSPIETPEQEMQRVAGPQVAAPVPAVQQPPSNIPVESQTAPTGNWMRNESTGETFSIGPNNEIQKYQGEPSAKGRAFAGSKQGGKVNDDQRSFSTGNLDVEFDDSVEPSMRKEFLAGPEVSSAQGHYATHLNQSNFGGGRDSRAGRSSGSDLDTGKIRTFGDIMRTKAAMKDRRETAAIDNANDRTFLTGRGQNIQMAQNAASNALARDKNAIDAENTKSQIEQRRLTGEGTQLDTEQKRRLADLQNEYVSEKDPKRRKELKRQLLTLAGKNETNQQIVTEDVINDLGQKVGQKFWTPDPNDPSKLIPVATDGSQQPAGDAAGAVPWPGDQSKLVKGQLYLSANGKFRGVWDGNQLTGIKPVQ